MEAPTLVIEGRETGGAGEVGKQQKYWRRIVDSSFNGVSGLWKSVTLIDSIPHLDLSERSGFTQ